MSYKQEHKPVKALDRLVLRHLSAERGLTPIFSGLNLTANDGDLIQVMGANGSGKSTFLRVVAGLIPAESGAVLWNGLDTAAAAGSEFNANSVYLGHKNGIAEDLTALENLDYFLKTRGATASCSAQEALDTVAFSAAPQQVAGKISAGQKQRLALAKLVSTDIKLWLLDEPFSALDSDGKTIVESMLAQHCARGGIGIVATHQQIGGDVVRVRHLQLS